MNPLLTSVTSAAERVETREDTIDQLESVGLTVSVSLSAPNDHNADLILGEATRYEAAGRRVWTSGNPDKGYGGVNNIAAARMPLLYACDNHMDLLYCEDDLDLAPDFPWFLDLAREASDAATYLYTHDFRTEKQQASRYGLRTWKHLRHCAHNGKPFEPRGLYRIRNTEHVNSGQCIYLPHDVITKLPLFELSRTKSAIDTWLQHRLTKVGVPVLTALPHPVQHRHCRMGRPANPRHKTKFSMSFDLR